MKMAMDTAKGKTADLTQILEANTRMMEQSANPHRNQPGYKVIKALS